MIATFNIQGFKYPISASKEKMGILLTYFDQWPAGTSIFLSLYNPVQCKYVADKMGISISDAVNLLRFVCQKFPDEHLVDELDLQHWMHALLEDQDRPVT